MKRIRLLPAAARVVLGGVFIYAAVLKIADPVGFAGSIAAYRIAPYFGNYLAAAILPWVELISGTLLVCGIRVRAGAAAIASLNFVFIVALISAIVRGLDIDCGCFREAARTSPWTALLRDLLLMTVTLYVLKSSPARVEGAVAGEDDAGNPSPSHCNGTDTPSLPND